ncbi:MAG TPA: TetR/AcrR family transcriptional regulator [Accumulibacter sp.]|nr:TetR/AcrR family transcriptional regulator [Accumulibacter sp.]HMW16629.1 TetR/AcrR family transcriptional regulator [Accumulibacter sp.]HMY06690.1 TetR/AcrR family transcriptional regulator [Accumulibacter sp.]HNC16697.1 TetR/AcrR family transcriptional regulator [Accumulibacter sp.]HND79329.1 TetR/AcrR family transcriptional regulator [Accumulibacter sp.]
MSRRRKDGASLEANRREALLRTAARLFVEKGFEATTTRDIADAVGMRPGSPFYHFRSKHDLLKAAMIAGIDGGLQRLQAAVADVADPERRLRTMIRTHLGTLLENDCPAPLLFYESRSLDAGARAEMTAATDRYQQIWQTTLDELAAAGRLRGPAKATRLLLFGMLNSCSQWYRPDGAFTLESIADLAAEMVLV